MRVAGLFAGIGGLELGLEAGGNETVLLCEKDAAAKRVLAHRFPGVPLRADITVLASLPRVDLLAAGFPCTDLSQVGRTRGISGSESGLVDHLFRLVDRARKKPEWVLLENVPFMLRLDRGKAISHLVAALEERRYRWAYRTIDTRAFGIPQRRKRVFLLAGRNNDPRHVLLCGSEAEPEWGGPGDHACGFYWTEGNRGLGWAVNAIPTLKAGSGLGIPSPPAIRLSGGQLGVPDIRDAERFQGFQPYWTSPAGWDDGRTSSRWRLVGNAVSVPVSKWLGKKLASPGAYDQESDDSLFHGDRWPAAAWGADGKVFESTASAFPVRYLYRDLETFLRFPLRQLSLKAASGFLRRIQGSSLRIPEGLEESLIHHCGRLEGNLGDLQGAA